MLLARETDAVSAIRAPTPSDPLRVLVSGCIAGMPCGVDGTDHETPWYRGYFRPAG